MEVFEGDPIDVVAPVRQVTAAFQADYARWFDVDEEPGRFGALLAIYYASQGRDRDRLTALRLTSVDATLMALIDQAAQAAGAWEFEQEAAGSAMERWFAAQSLDSRVLFVMRHGLERALELVRAVPTRSLPRGHAMYAWTTKIQGLAADRPTLVQVIHTDAQVRDRNGELWVPANCFVAPFRGMQRMDARTLTRADGVTAAIRTNRDVMISLPSLADRDAQGWQDRLSPDYFVKEKGPTPFGAVAHTIAPRRGGEAVLYIEQFPDGMRHLTIKAASAAELAAIKALQDAGLLPGLTWAPIASDEDDDVAAPTSQMKA